MCADFEIKQHLSASAAVVHLAAVAAPRIDCSLPSAEWFVLVTSIVNILRCGRSKNGSNMCLGYFVSTENGACKGMLDVPARIQDLANSMFVPAEVKICIVRRTCSDRWDARMYGLTHAFTLREPFPEERPKVKNTFCTL